MAKIRRVIRRTKPATQTGFDEQFWPVILALFVLGGFLMGMALAYLPLDEPRWYANGITWLFAVPIFICLIIWLLRNIRSRAVRRSVQFSAVICLILHLILFIITIETNIFGRFWEKYVQQSAEEPPDLVLEPQYEPFQMETSGEEKPDLFRPVTSEAPTPPAEDVVRKPTPTEQVSREPQPIPVPETQATVAPHAIERQPQAETSPRQSEQTSLLSRQTSQAQPRPNQLAAQPETTPPRAARPSPLQAQDASPDRRATQLQAQRRAVSPEPTTTARDAEIQMTRRSEQPSPRPEAAPPPTFERRVAQPSVIPRSEVDLADRPAQPQQTQPAALVPNTQAAQQQPRRSPAAERVARQPNVDTSIEATQRVQRREQRSDRQPTLAQTPAPVPNRQTRLTNRPDVATMASELADQPAPAAAQPAAMMPNPLAAAKRAAAGASVDRPATAREAEAPGRVAAAMAQRREARDAPQLASAGQASTARNVRQADPSTATTADQVSGTTTGETARALAPTETALAQNQGTTAPVRSQTGAQPAEVAATRPTAASAATSRRAVSSPAPTLDPAADASAAPARTTRSAQMVASPTNAASPAAAQTERGMGQPLAEPARMALARSETGTAGTGQSANLDRALPASRSPGMMASGSARRKEATQDRPAGPDLTPSSQARVRRSLAERALPSANIHTTVPDTATLAGATQPSELTASSSASLSRQDANARQADVAAARGAVAVDMGPTQIVGETGEARASGGGQPELNLDTQAPQLARTRPGGRPQVAVAVSDVAPDAVTPPADGGGQPPSPFDPAATELSRAKADSDSAATGGIAAAEPGPATGDPAASVAASIPGEMSEGRRESSEGQPEMPGEEDDEEIALLARNERVAPNPLAMSSRVDAVAGIPTAAAAGGAQAADVALGQQSTESQAMAGRSPAVDAPEMPAGGGQVLGESTLARAEAVEAAMGRPEPGGGTTSPERSQQRSELAMNVQADTLSLSGSPQSAGAESGTPLSAQGVEPQREAGGAPATLNSAPVGAIAGDFNVDNTGTGPTDMMRGALPRAAGENEGPAVGTDRQIAAPLRRASVARLNLSTAADAVDVTPQTPRSITVASADFDLAAGTEIGPMSRPSAGAIPVEVPGTEGPGGLGAEPALDVGLNSRRSQRESLQVSSRAVRFIRQEFGGRPDFNTTAVIPADSFRRRASRTAGMSGDERPGSPGPQTEEAIERGLVFLARQQSPNGNWTLEGNGESVALSSDTAATALALLAYLGAGYNHREHEYAKVVAEGLNYLVENQKENGDLHATTDEKSNQAVWLYSHGIAALALTEAYGMTQDPDLRDPAQRALNFVVQAQDKDYGGWRYSPGVGSDTSVTGWMMMALRSGELAGLEVPPKTYERNRRWLDFAQASRTEPHLFRYNPFAPDTPTQRHGRSPSPTMTAVGLLMRLYDGWRRDRESMMRGADYLLANAPAIGTTRDPKRDTYYWYYGTQVMFHMGGRHWEQWNSKLHPLLITSQVENGPLMGSWNPRTPVADRWSPHAGRLYVTTLNLLSLEVYYRHLPLYEDTAR